MSGSIENREPLGQIMLPLQRNILPENKFLRFPFQSMSDWPLSSIKLVQHGCTGTRLLCNWFTLPTQEVLGEKFLKIGESLVVAYGLYSIHAKERRFTDCCCLHAVWSTKILTRLSEAECRSDQKSKPNEKSKLPLKSLQQGFHDALPPDPDIANAY